MYDRAAKHMGTVHAVVGKDIANTLRKHAAASRVTTSAFISALLVEAMLGRGLIDADSRPAGRTIYNRAPVPTL